MDVIEVKHENMESSSAQASASTPNPWDVDNVNHFLFYCCPECPFSAKAVVNFKDHAVDNHPKVNKDPIITNVNVFKPLSAFRERSFSKIILELKEKTLSLFPLYIRKMVKQLWSKLIQVMCTKWLIYLDQSKRIRNVAERERRKQRECLCNNLKPKNRKLIH